MEDLDRDTFIISMLTDEDIARLVDYNADDKNYIINRALFEAFKIRTAQGEPYDAIADINYDDELVAKCIKILNTLTTYEPGLI